MTLFRVNPLSGGAGANSKEQGESSYLRKRSSVGSAEKEENTKEGPSQRLWQKAALSPSCRMSWQELMALEWGA